MGSVPFPLELQRVTAVVVGVLWKVTPQRSFSFPQVTPVQGPGQARSSGAEGQLRDYLHRSSDSCQGGGKDYSATSLELLAEREHNTPLKVSFNSNLHQSKWTTAAPLPPVPNARAITEQDGNTQECVFL